MFSKVFFTLAAFTLAVTAQDSTTTTSAANATASALAGISPCVLACVIPAATTNGCSFTNVTCVCASAQFQADATACLLAHCTQADLVAAQTLQSSQCTAAGISATGTPTTTHSIAFSTSSSNSTATGSGTNTGAGATTTPTSPAGTSAGTSGTGSTASPTTTTSSAANGIAVNLAFIMAAIAGLLTL